MCKGKDHFEKVLGKIECVFSSLVVNVMQRDSIPSEVDYETRQGVYSICLQLARYVTNLSK